MTLKIRCGVDAREIERGMTGIGRYLKGFIKYASGTSHEYFLYYSRKPEVDLGNSNIQVRVLSSPKFIWDHIALPKALKKDKVDLFFSPYYKKPWSLKCKSIVTVHDLNPLYSKNSSFWHRIYFKKLLKRSIYSADFVLVVSAYVKEQILELFKPDANKIIVNYNAIDERFCPIENDNFLKTVLAKYGIKSEYIFYVGNLMPHKNIPSLVRAYAGLPDNLKDKYKLVIGGSKRWTYKQLVKLVNKLGLVKNVSFTGFIPENDLVYLYNGAGLFVFPSLYEGFGFPPLEAMACGTPVVASNVSSLPEILGDAGILVDPCKVNDISEAITKVLTESELRDSLVERGLRRVRQFSTEKMSRKIIEAFEVLNEKA